MLPSMVSYNTTGCQDMEDEDLSALGAAADLAEELSDSSFEFNPTELLSAPVFDSDDELERIPNSAELQFNDHPSPSQVSHEQQSSGSSQHVARGEGQTMFLDANGFPAAPPKTKKRKPIPEDQRPRRIPGLVKQGSSKSSLLSRGARSLQSPAEVNSGMGFQGGTYRDNNMEMTMDTTFSNSTMDVNMNTSPHDMDVPMSPEPEGSCLQVPGNDLRSYNDAMEKLCESMKRSAMTRNLVKGFSNHSLQKDGSSRSIGSGTQITHPSTSRQSSGRSLNVVSRNSSARSLVHQNSGRALVQQGSVCSLDDDGLATLSTAFPSQRHSSHRHALEARHRARHGVVRHNSSNAVHGSRPRGHRMSQPYDDSGLGLVFDGKNMYS